MDSATPKYCLVRRRNRATLHSFISFVSFESLLGYGASIYDVRTRAGEGGHGEADEGNRGCVNVTVTGGEVSKNPIILRTSYMEGPKRFLLSSRFPDPLRLRASSLSLRNTSLPDSIRGFSGSRRIRPTSKTAK